MTSRPAPNIQTQKFAPKCHHCQASLKVAPKVVLEGHWVCAACAYELEYGEPKKEKRRRFSGPPQEETLFPLPPPTEKGDR